MSVNNVMKLLDYRVLKTRFELSTKLELKDQNFRLHHNFKRNIKKIDNNKYRIMLGFVILQEENEDLIPFELEVFILGVFELENWEDDDKVEIAINNATAVLFPYLRNLVSTTTLNGNVSPYVIPLVNVAQLFNNKKDK